MGLRRYKRGHWEPAQADGSHVSRAISNCYSASFNTEGWMMPGIGHVLSDHPGTGLQTNLPTGATRCDELGKQVSDHEFRNNHKQRVTRVTWRDNSTRLRCQVVAGHPTDSARSCQPMPPEAGWRSRALTPAATPGSVILRECYPLRHCYLPRKCCLPGNLPRKHHRNCWDRRRWRHEMSWQAGLDPGSAAAVA